VLELPEAPARRGRGRLGGPRARQYGVTAAEYAVMAAVAAVLLGVAFYFMFQQVSAQDSAAGRCVAAVPATPPSC
jgi:Flp pilus assembly pilin Flp